MANLINYLVLVGLYQALWLLPYFTILAKRNSFSFNRAFLLLGLVGSFVFPLLPELSSIQGGTDSTKAGGSLLLEPIISYSFPTETQQGSSYAKLIWGIYLLGAAVQLFLFGIASFRLWKTIRLNEVSLFSNVKVIRLSHEKMAFSFFNWIFLPRLEDETQERLIFLHELVHAKQYHSADRLICAITRIIGWCIPSVYLFQNALTEQHEFLADKEVIGQAPSPSVYAELMVEQLFDLRFSILTTHFSNLSITQKRLNIMKKPHSRMTTLQKALSFGMIVFCSVALWACTQNQMITEPTFAKRTNFKGTDLGITDGFELVETFEIDQKSAQPIPVKMDLNTNYQVSMATENGSFDGITITLYSPDGNKLVANAFQGKFYPGFQFKCREAGEYKIEITLDPNRKDTFLMGIAKK